MCGKVSIIKSLLIPKLVYEFSLLPTPANIIRQLENEISILMERELKDSLLKKL